MTRAEASRFTSSMATTPSRSTASSSSLTRGTATRYTSDMGNAPSAPTSRAITLAHQTLWSSMAYTGVTGIGGNTVGDARARQQAGLAALRGTPNSTTFETAAIIAGGNIRTREQMTAMGIPMVNRMAISLGLQRASYELRYSSVSGTQLRINIDSTLRYGPANLRTRVTFSQGANGSWVQTAGDIGANIQPQRTATPSSGVGVFGGLRFTGEGVSLTGSASATVRSPLGTTHGGSGGVTSPTLRYNSLLPQRSNPVQNGRPSQSSPGFASLLVPMSRGDNRAAIADLNRYLNSVR
ncbi:MAG: hypothetical protein LPK02_13320 [Rhodobacterales bacterium]|nr:hypothetical protein [Rhodobacterales bacterium]MDX5501602.1 hypothetical protein [Rhodobacterales bacterium]